MAIAFLTEFVGRRLDKTLKMNFVVLFCFLIFGGRRMLDARRQQSAQGVRGAAALSWKVHEVLAWTTVLVVCMGSLSIMVEFSEGR